MMNKFIEVQRELKAPKGNYNSFGKYRYRSCEDILQAVKPLLAERGLMMTITDEVVNLGERFYIKATATVTADREAIASASAYARESDEKKGMDSAQVTGAASSYARKYALNGLFLIDDTKDADTDEFQNQTLAASEDEKIARELSEPVTATQKKSLMASAKAMGINIIAILE